MRLKSIVLFLSVGPTLACAQSSVTLYGVVDTSVAYTNHASPSGGSELGLVDSGFWSSLFGLTGSEDIGGGNKVIFKLENAFDATNGTLIPDGVLFNRTAMVGVRTAYGTLTAGRQNSVQYDQTLWYDPTLLAAYSLLSLQPIPLATLRLSNSVKYQSENVGGFNFEAMYSFGQQVAGNALAGRYIGSAVEYVRGPFAITAIYGESRGGVAPGVDASSLVDRRYTLNVRYAVPYRYIVSAGVTHIGGDLEWTPRGTVYWAAAGYWPTPAVNVTLTAGRYDYQGTGQHSALLTTSARYFLSKKTFVYANVGYMGNQGNAALSIYGYNVSEPGKNQFGASIGIDQEF
jgi:Outer membrane protein (porin)